MNFLPKHASSRGFSMVEILVAVAVIAVLLALIVPGAKQFLSFGASSKCLNNMRQIYMMTLAFTDDHRGMLPPPVGQSSSNNNGMLQVHESYGVNAWWWSQAYLGQYLGGRPRSRFSSGRLTQEEAEIFNCPARAGDPPDSFFADANYPGVSYVMFRPEFIKGSPVPRDIVSAFNFRAMDNKALKPYITEGRKHVIYTPDALTGQIGETNNSRLNSHRLRRFHNGGLNVLFYDGHVERFAESDQEFRRRFFN